MKLLSTDNEINEIINELFPLTRSITGDGVRKTHDILNDYIPLTRIEVPSNTEVYDWKVPQEWEINEAYIIGPSGKKIIDFKENNLHILNYSIGFEGTLTLDELKKNIYTLPDQPDVIPYVTSYYKKRWGFSMTHNQLNQLPEGEYYIKIDAKHFDGSLTISECILPGKVHKEILISTYTCHPSLGNNELSGPIVTTLLYQKLKNMKDRYFTYRFVFLPETIGSICYLNKYEKKFKRDVVGGFVITCVGDKGTQYVLKKSKIGNSLIDKISEQYLINNNINHKVYEYWPSGSDERQYCSLGFNLPICSITKSMYGSYPEYHTSSDNKEFISVNSMIESSNIYYNIISDFENNFIYERINKHCEIFLSKYNGLSSNLGIKDMTCNDSLFWLMSLSDGQTPLLNISKKSKTAPTFEEVGMNTLKYCSIENLKKTSDRLTDLKIFKKKNHAIFNQKFRLGAFMGNHLRHKYYINQISKFFNFDFIVCQGREKSILEVPEGLDEIDRKNWIEHFNERDKTEKEYFKEYEIPDTDILYVEDQNDMHSQKTIKFIKNHKFDYKNDIVLVFGTGIIRESITKHLPYKTINMHLGLSPRYRGAATLFWPFYFLEPQYCGVTFHYLLDEPDAGDVIHQTLADLKLNDQIFDVAWKLIIKATKEIIDLLIIYNNGTEFKEYKQTSTGKNFLERDFKPEHLRTIYQVFKNNLVDYIIKKGYKTPYYYKKNLEL